MRTVLLIVFSFLLLDPAQAASCNRLDGRDYDLCKVYKDDSSCSRLNGRDYDLCKVYKDSVSPDMIYNWLIFSDADADHFPLPIN